MRILRSGDPSTDQVMHSFMFAFTLCEHCAGYLPVPRDIQLMLAKGRKEDMARQCPGEASVASPSREVRD